MTDQQNRDQTTGRLHDHLDRAIPDPPSVAGWAASSRERARRRARNRTGAVAAAVVLVALAGVGVPALLSSGGGGVATSGLAPERAPASGLPQDMGAKADTPSGDQEGAERPSIPAGVDCGSARAQWQSGATQTPFAQRDLAGAALCAPDAVPVWDFPPDVVTAEKLADFLTGFPTVDPQACTRTGGTRYLLVLVRSDGSQAVLPGDTDCDTLGTRGGGKEVLTVMTDRIAAARLQDLPARPVANPCASPESLLPVRLTDIVQVRVCRGQAGGATGITLSPQDARVVIADLIAHAFSTEMPPPNQPDPVLIALTDSAGETTFLRYSAGYALWEHPSGWLSEAATGWRPAAGTRSILDRTILDAAKGK